jgi:WD40 repeat-containing protein SMU1
MREKKYFFQLFNMEIESSDVIRLIQQFFKEANLISSLKSLEQETGIYLNAIDNIPDFKLSIINGKWNSVLKYLGELEIPCIKLIDLYELILVDLININQIAAARSLLRKSEVTQLMRETYPERFSYF